MAIIAFGLRSKLATDRIVICFAGTLLFALASSAALAQVEDWDPGVPKEMFKDGQTSDKKPKPTHRLAPAPDNCPECKQAVADLQAALDDWYALELADGEKLRSDGIKNSDFKEGSQQQKNGKAEIEDAMAGLGQPSDGGAAAKKKQSQNAKAKPKTSGDKAALAKQIKKLTDAVQDCLKKCGGKGEEATPTPTPTPTQVVPGGGGGGTAQPPPPNITIPPPPAVGCFKDQDEKDAYLDKLDKQRKPIFGQWYIDRKEANEDDATQAAKNKFAQSDANLRAIDAAIAAATAMGLCPTPTPKPGGGGKAPTPGKGKPKAPPKVKTGGNVSLPEDNFCALISDNKIKIDTAGTGETIGHVADLTFENVTDEPLTVVVPPLILESRSGKNQHYACPKGETVEVPPHEKKTVPLDGVCLVRNKPPVSKGQTGDLLVSECDGGSQIAKEKADELLRIAKSKYDAADSLEDDGKLKEIPYKDKKKRKEIVEQWSTWMDPRISEITGAPPATKDDLRKVVYKQVEAKGKMTPETKKKVDQGIDTIFEKVELTTAKAKDLEKPEEENIPEGEPTVEETPSFGQPEYVGHTAAKKPTPSPTPKKAGGTKTKPTPTPTATPKKQEPKNGGTTEEKPTGQPENPPTPDKNAKPKEAVVVVQVNGDPTNRDMLRSANALKNHLDDAGQDAQRVVMGNIPGADIQSLDELERYLKNKVMKGACLHSIHIFGHGRKNESTGNYVFDFPPRSGKEDEEDVVWVQDEDPMPAKQDEKPIRHAEFGKENFAKIFKTVLCEDGEAFLEECYSAAGKNSLAQYIADKSGRKVHGHTTTVLFPLDMPPRPGETDQPVTANPKK